MAIFTDIFEDITHKGRKIPSDYYLRSGKYQIIDQGKDCIAGFCDENDGLFEAVPAIIFGDHTRILKYVDKPFFIGADGVKVLRAKEGLDVDYKYLYYALNAIHIIDAGYSRHFKYLKESDVVVKDIEEQHRIANNLDKLEELISAANLQLAKLDELVKAKFVEMFGDPERNSKKWKKMFLSELITNANNGMARRGHDENGNIVLRLVELQSGRIDYSNINRISLSETEQEKYVLKANDFLFARVNGNPENVGRCAQFHEISEPVYYNDHIIRVHFNEALLNGEFASSILNSHYGKIRLRAQIKTSAGQYTISRDGINAIEIIIPPLNLQEDYAIFKKHVERSKRKICKKLDNLETLKKSLMQEYFG